jgi:hypothetical protein
MGFFGSVTLLRMKPRVAQLVQILLATVVAIGCGSPGVPLPPSLEVARPVTDLRAARKGNRVTLTWSRPTQTTEQRNLKRAQTVEICRGFAAMKQCGAPVAKIPFPKPAVKQTQRSQQETYTDELPANPAEASQAIANIYYGVSIVNSYRHSAGLSNPAQVPAAPALGPPENFQAQLTRDGVKLSWNAIPNPPNIPSIRFVYRIYRRQAGTQSDAVAGEVPVAGESSPSFLDHGFEWEKTYDYRATVVTKIGEADGSEQQVEGDDTSTVSVVAHDVFPPVTPTGLQAVFSGPGQKPFIDLVWAPNSEPDLAGYNVYRHEAGAQPVKINKDVVSSPAYRDADVSAGHEYTYSVSAVDVPGNESSHSEEASESVP